jgi:transcriptional regulator with GAF, ATPase, and Fis domain
MKGHLSRVFGPDNLGISASGQAGTGTPFKLIFTHYFTTLSQAKVSYDRQEVALCAPLQLKERVVGVVTVSGRENGKPFTDYEADFLATLATHAAIALVNAGNFYRLKKTG